MKKILKSSITVLLICLSLIVIAVVIIPNISESRAFGFYKIIPGKKRIHIEEVKWSYTESGFGTSEDVPPGEFPPGEFPSQMNIIYNPYTKEGELYIMDSFTSGKLCSFSQMRGKRLKTGVGYTYNGEKVEIIWELDKWEKGESVSFSIIIDKNVTLTAKGRLESVIMYLL